jgi:pimeloyl-ACP methyl ester carboxylesterase
MNGIASSPDGVALAYEVHGAGTPALVFVHGWSCDRSYWRNQLEHFAQYFRVVALDLAGHGESGAGRGEWTMSSFGRDVAAVVDQLNLDDAVLIGHSMGVDVVVEAALQLPGRVRGLVLVDQYASLGQPRTRERTRALVAPFIEDFATATRILVRGMFVPSSPAEVVEWVSEDMAAAPEDVALGALEQTWSNDGPILESLPKVAVPIVAINSDSRPTDIEALERYGIRTLIVPGVGHFMMLENPETFNRLLSETIAGFKPLPLRSSTGTNPDFRP